MHVRPLDSADLAALEALPEQAQRDLAAAVPTAWSARLATASGTSVHRLGAWRGDALAGVVELTPLAWPRRRHIGVVRVTADDAEAATAIVLAAVALADDWLGLSRLEATLDATREPLAAALASAGFVAEVRWPELLSAGHDRRDAVVWARLAPGFAPTLATTPRWELRRAPAAATLRATAPDDAAAIAAMMRDPAVAWGTLQVPSTTTDAWAPRLATSASASWVLEEAGRLVGNVAMIRLPAPSAHVATLGMAIAGAAQGQGLGRQLLDHVLAQARDAGLERLVLEVYTDNDRALALYRRAGFVACGIKRADARRPGGFADAMAMIRRVDAR